MASGIAATMYAVKKAALIAPLRAWADARAAFLPKSACGRNGGGPLGGVGPLPCATVHRGRDLPGHRWQGIHGCDIHIRISPKGATLRPGIVLAQHVREEEFR